MYADDTQLYMPCTAEDSEGAVSKIEDCVADVKKWMSCNFLRGAPFLNRGGRE